LSEAKKAFIGSLTLTFSKLSERVLGLLSTLILARLLIPEDFGIIAISLIVIGLFKILGQTGGLSYIIQKKDVDEQDLHTAWTLDLLVKTLIFIIILISAPFISAHYEDQRLTAVISILAIMLPSAALCNPHFMLLRREQKYGLIFKLDITKKVVAVASVIIVAVIYQNYWAMVVGHLVSNVIQLVGSYILIRHKPFFCLKGVSQQWGFSKWMLSKGVLGYVRSQVDTLLVSNFYGPSQVGAYHVTKYISTMPGSEVLGPATEPLLATFSRNKKDPEALRYQYKLTLLVVMALAIPLAMFLYVHSLPIVQILLGDNWVEYHRVFGVLALMTFSMSLGSIVSQIITCTGRVKVLFYYDLISVIAMCVLLYSVKDLSIEVFSWYRIGFEWVIVCMLSIYCMLTVLKVNPLYLVKIITCSVLVGSLSCLASYLCYIEELNVFIAMLISGITFLLVWGVSCWLLYYLYFKRLQEGAHIAFLVVKTVQPVTAKLLSNR
jgi:O-antigen/teichoic acid export membrane protein